MLLSSTLSVVAFVYLFSKKAKRSRVSDTSHKCLSRQAERLCVGKITTARERGVSIWAELRMRAGELLKQTRRSRIRD